MSETQHKDELILLGESIRPGESRQIHFNIAKLHTHTPIDIPVIVERAAEKGPVVLFTAGIHGDEVNGVEIVRQLIAKGINKPKKGTIICLPVINIFGFIHMDREFPDGRDLNRVFPGSKSGSLASRLAHMLITEIAPKADLIIDYHTGGADRFNAPHIRISKGNPDLEAYARTFGSPFVLYAKHLKKTFRKSCAELGIPMLLFEGGKSYHFDTKITRLGVNGAKRVLSDLNMLGAKFKASIPRHEIVIIERSRWIRAKYSGMFRSAIKPGTYMEKGAVIGHITDPFGRFHHFVKAPCSGYIFNVNEAPIVHKGDALFHTSIQLKDD